MVQTPKSILITGCAGFIGSHFTRACLKLGHNVMGVDKMTYASNWEYITEFELYPNFEFKHRDINDIGFIRDTDYVVNFAAESHVDKSIEGCEEFIHSNINGVHSLLECIKNNKEIKLIQISTDEVYGDIERGSHDETDDLNPSNPYAATKASADLLIQSYARTYSINYNIIRLTNNYGLGQNCEKLIPKTIKFLEWGRKLPLHNNGTPIRNWLHVSDSVNAILTVIQNGKDNEIYNVNGNYEDSNINIVKEIVFRYTDRIGKEYNINEYVDFTYNRPGQDIRYNLDDTKLRNLGWEPKADFFTELEKL